MVPEPLTNQAVALLNKIENLKKVMRSPVPHESLLLGTYYEQAAATFYLVGEFETACTLQQRAYETCGVYPEAFQLGSKEYQLRDSELLRSLVNLALFLSLTKDRSNAKGTILHAIDIMNQRMPTLYAQKCMAYCAAGRIFRESFDLKAAEYYLRKIPTLIDAWDNEAAISMAGDSCEMVRKSILQKYLYELGVVYHKMHEDSKAQVLLSKVTTVGGNNVITSLCGLSMNGDIDFSERLSAKAEIENALGNYESARKIAFRSLEIQDAILPSAHPLRCTTLVCIGKSYHGVGDLVKAREYFLKAQRDGMKR